MPEDCWTKVLTLTKKTIKQEADNSCEQPKLNELREHLNFIIHYVEYCKNENIAGYNEH